MAANVEVAAPKEIEHHENQEKEEENAKNLEATIFNERIQEKVEATTGTKAGKIRVPGNDETKAFLEDDKKDEKATMVFGA